MTKRPGPRKGTVNNPKGKQPLPDGVKRVLITVRLAPSTVEKLRLIAPALGGQGKAIDAGIDALINNQ